MKWVRGITLFLLISGLVFISGGLDEHHLDFMFGHTEASTNGPNITNRDIDDLKKAIDIKIKAIDELLISIEGKPGKSKSYKTYDNSRALLQGSSDVLLDQKHLLEGKKGIDQAQSFVYMIKALALGALGAFIPLLLSSSKRVNNKTFSKTKSLLTDDIFFGEIAQVCLVGAIISFLVFGMFMTGFVTVFTDGPSFGSGTLDLWKQVVVCVVSGAFAERIHARLAGQLK